MVGTYTCWLRLAGPMAELGSVELEAADADDAALAFGRLHYSNKPFKRLDVMVKPEGEHPLSKVVHALV